MNNRSVIRRYPLVFYFALAYLISWGGSFLVGGPKFLRGEPLDLDDTLMMAPIMLAGPFIAGIAMTLLCDGRNGIRELFSRMIRWRVGMRWYAAALLIFPILILLVLISLAAIVSTDFAPRFIAFGITAGVFAGFVEETGWMGFAYPKMEESFGVWRATIVLALIHGSWHVMADFLGSFAAHGIYWLPRFIFMWFIAMTAMRVLLVWIYRNTGSLLLAQLTHASSTGFLVMLGPAVSPANEMIWFAVYAVVLWIPALIVIAKFGTSLGRRDQIAEV
ncbi:MAG: CPBP family intramembrane metalloprotease [Acidobacteriota bacterium]|nr:CPBP family intramembrane metalloprotease [Acidobacteriota bacterium]MDH3528714.1 CPBP family intramembrane metalloprotease [Acidobacteriota bacterium]